MRKSRSAAPDEAPYLTMPPSEYVKSGRIYFGVECEEKTIPDGVRWGLDDTLLYSSDYPALGWRLAAHHPRRARAEGSVGGHQAKDAARQRRPLLWAASRHQRHYAESRGHGRGTITRSAHHRAVIGQGRAARGGGPAQR